MPTVFRHNGYRFFFYSNEGNPVEPLHIHVIKAENVAKLWIEPDVVVAESYGMTSSELKMLCQVVEEKRGLIVEVWNEYFGS